MHIALNLDQARQPTALAIGNFDGIHQGHQQVLDPILSQSNPSVGKQSGSPLKTVLTFYPHPQEVFTGQPRLCLTPPEEKQALLANLGFEQVVQLPFTPEFARLSPQQFIQQILQQGLGVTRISVGWDFRFGSGRTGEVSQLKDWAIEQGIDIHVVPKAEIQGERVSSSRIRSALSTGDPGLAQLLLGRPYRLQGQVIQGDQRGRQLGFPTANLALPSDKFLPRDGVYGVWVHLSPDPLARPLMGVMNLGVRPTVDGSRRQLEVHVLDWQGDLYGQVIGVDLNHFVRPEQRFGSLDQLQHQISVDCETVRQFLATR